MSKKIQKKVQVWIVNRTNKGDRYLILRVIPERASGWHPITGSVEKDEMDERDWLAAAKRETLEETGIPPKAGTWVDLEYSHSFKGRWGFAEEHVYGLILENFKGQITLHPKEHEELEWVSLKEALNRVTFDSQRRALEAFSCYLDSL